MTTATTLVDTNVLVDVLTNDREWRAWSIGMLDQQAGLGSLTITDVTYSELAPQFSSSRLLDSAIAALGVVLARIPTEALFIAGHCFTRYRSRGGIRPNVLADFFIGAHAQVLGCAVLTRDVRRYRSYFPEVGLIAPEPS
jgi:predicted nucleic acid-binding protein